MEAEEEKDAQESSLYKEDSFRMYCMKVTSPIQGRLARRGVVVSRDVVKLLVSKTCGFVLPKLPLGRVSQQWHSLLLPVNRFCPAPKGTAMTGQHVHSHILARKQEEEIPGHSLTQASHALIGRR